MATYYVWLPVMGRRSSITAIEATSREEARAKAKALMNYSVQTYDELPKFIKSMLPKGADNDIDKNNTPVKAYVVYWDAHKNIISQPTIHAETVYPLSLIDSIRAFRPEFAKGCNVDFEYADGTLSVTNVIKF